MSFHAWVDPATKFEWCYSCQRPFPVSGELHEGTFNLTSDLAAAAGAGRAANIVFDEHSQTVLRYVERNPLRANIVERSQDCEWSSLKPTARSRLDGWLCDGPIQKPAQRTRHVNGAETEAELKALRHSLARGIPFGDPQWQAKNRC